MGRVFFCWFSIVLRLNHVEVIGVASLILTIYNGFPFTVISSQLKNHETNRLVF
jgi:hypothetical protein